MKFKKHTCCEKCHNYWTCEDKWYSGENNQESVCCELCGHYFECAGTKKGTGKKKTLKV